MHVPWPNNKCILCLGKDSLTIEHIIPEALGGVLTSQFLCRKCNSTFGQSFEAAARSDPSIRIAIENLEERIPKLAAKMRENQAYVAKGNGGKTSGRIRDGEFIISSRTDKDGSLIQPSKEARKSIETKLRKSGSGMAPLAEALQKFDEMPENERVEVAPSLEVEKWSIEDIEIDLNGSRLMSPLVPLKIAFEFLACHLGSAIYDEAAQLSQIRQALYEGLEEDSCYRVERLNAKKYEPFHGVCFEGNKPHAQVQIRLFGLLSFRVHFLRLAVGGDRFIYTHYLDTNRDYIQILP